MNGVAVGAYESPSLGPSLAMVLSMCSTRYQMSSAMLALENCTLVVPRPSQCKEKMSIKAIISTIPSEIPENHVVIKVDKFAFSTNNITYQALGEVPQFRYFDFHPSPGDPDQYGVIPVWGHGTVILSTVKFIRISERVFGYFGMSRYLLLSVNPMDSNEFNFYVLRPHLPPDRRPYNQITRCLSDKLYRPEDEDFSMIYRPLFWTSFWAEDWLYTSPSDPYSGATTILISSASSKTAFCLAYLCRKRRLISLPKRRLTIIGLTSALNIEFTRQLFLYDSVATYDNLESILNKEERWIFVDVAGNQSIDARILNKLQSSLIRYISLGATNLKPTEPGKYVLPTSGITESAKNASGQAEFFFMPEWLAKRRKALKASQIAAMQSKAWTELMCDCRSWLQIVHSHGVQDVCREYIQVFEKGISPKAGMIWSLWDKKDTVDSLNSKL